MFKKRSRFMLLMVALVSLALVLTACSSTPSDQKAGQSQPAPENKDVILATTTSTQDSGLLDEILPAFEQKTGYKVKTISVGTGQALAMGEKGEADVLLVHAPDSEMKVVEKGAAVNRNLVMHNDFILIGPKDDPAKIKGTKTTAEAFKKIAETKKLFVSRGDDSGTHKLELKIWKAAGITPAGNSWYQETGSGMGQSLNVASEKNGYLLTDRATFLAQSQKRDLGLEIVLEKEPALLNIYHVMDVNPEKFPKVNKDGAKAFNDFLISEEGQKIIKDFGVSKFGQPLFIPDAGKKVEELGV